MVIMNEITNPGAKLEIKHVQIANGKDIYRRCANPKDIAKIDRIYIIHVQIDWNKIIKNMNYLNQTLMMNGTVFPA